MQPQTPAPGKTPLESIEKSGKPEGPQSATIIERVKSSKTPGATTVTLVGNGHLAPAGVTESKDRPRRLVLDFPNVASKAPTQTAIDSPFVTRVRVAVNSHQPLVTRVVMEIAGTASYHVERGGDGGRDLAVVFEQAKPANTVTLTPEEVSGKPIEPEPPITMQQAIANAAAITRPEPAGELLDPMLALRAAAVTPPAVERAAPTAARPSAPPATRQATPPAAARSAAGTNGDRAGDRCADIGCCGRRPQARQVPGLQARAQAAQAAPAAQPLAPAPQGGTNALQGGTNTRGGQQPRQYTGDPLSLDLDGVDLRAVLRTLADVSGLNMIIDPDVQGTVDIKLTDVPWDQALDVILKGNQLDYSVDGTIVRISRIKTLEDENRARQSAAQAAAERQAQARSLVRNLPAELRQGR